MSYRSRNRARDPMMTTARFDSKCPSTGKEIKKGDEIAYYPALRKAYHASSPEAEHVRGLEFAKANNMADANY